MAKKDEQQTPSSADRMAANLNYNVKLDHIDFVDHGVLPEDNDYHKFKNEFIELWGLEKYQAESLKREARVEKLFGTDWKSKRISL